MSKIFISFGMTLDGFIAGPNGRPNAVQQSEYASELLGLEAIFQENKDKTGFSLLIDPESGNVVDRLTHTMNQQQLMAKISDRL